MKIQNALKIVAATLATTCATTLFAHEGHGLGGTHWHATDAWGFAVIGVAALAIWLTRGGK